MISKRNIVMILLLFISSLLFSARAANLLLIQKARTGSLVKLHRNYFLLTLEKPSSLIHYYDLQDKKYAGFLDLSKFLALWREPEKNCHFIDNPPEAIISSNTPEGKRYLLVVRLTNPGFDRGSMQYQIAVVGTIPVETALQSIKIYFYNFCSGSKNTKMPAEFFLSRPLP